MEAAIVDFNFIDPTLNWPTWADEPWRTTERLTESGRWETFRCLSNPKRCKFRKGGVIGGDQQPQRGQFAEQQSLTFTDDEQEATDE